MNRRHFIKEASCLTGALLTDQSGFAKVGREPVMDTHIHLFDTTRKGGVPWPEKDDLIYRPALPQRLESIAAPLGIVGAIAIEASPLSGDNDWLLDCASRSPFIVGVIGDLDPAAEDYDRSLNRLRKDKLFRGIRYGNLWGRNLRLDLSKPRFFDGLQLLADTGLVFESANPDAALIRALAETASKLPHLKIVVDHLPHFPLPDVKAERAAYMKDLQGLGSSPNVYAKLSEIAVKATPTRPSDLGSYRDLLDELWSIFGEDKLLYGSDWPNSDHVTPYQNVYRLFRQYMSTKAIQAQEKVSWRNSKNAYQWMARTKAQQL
jgi:L-fuconolactonase